MPRVYTEEDREAVRAMWAERKHAIAEERARTGSTEPWWVLNARVVEKDKLTDYCMCCHAL